MKESDSFYIIDRDEWKQLNNKTEISLSDQEVDSLRSLNDQVSVQDVKEIYLPILQILHQYIKYYHARQSEIKKILDRPESKEPYIIGIAGSVAVGKSTLARFLQTMMARAYPDKKVNLITTDGFLYPNEVLEERHMLNRKGFPESYDMHRLISFMGDVKSGRRDIKVPLYSHRLYNIVPDEFEIIDQPDILIVEGINVLQLPANEKIFVSDFFDFSFYVDAEPDRIEKWYLERFGLLLQTAFKDPTNYYYPYAAGDRKEAFKMAKNVWRTVNLKNLQEYILPTRFRADMIIHKTTDHFIDQLLLKKH
ncbi:type I pantothenate kinase [Alkalibacterium olivapovliticus]|uniref:Pantothenate kinase n=1 Tax=Alkalibacterium olivapovliticus TaxID=99907 RepID=A0A2T0W9U2_9LACT|nr:type I pantothenate kinase [Alkalibacterium olivapovliticus]PRY83471.1 pantothenate kinase [Alkalibacterium olivapovliticus]